MGLSVALKSFAPNLPEIQRPRETDREDVRQRRRTENRRKDILMRSAPAHRLILLLQVCGVERSQDDALD